MGKSKRNPFVLFACDTDEHGKVLLGFSSKAEWCYLVVCSLQMLNWDNTRASFSSGLSRVVRDMLVSHCLLCVICVLHPALKMPPNGVGSKGKGGINSHGFILYQQGDPWLRAVLFSTQEYLKFPFLEEELVRTREGCTHLILQEALVIPGNGSADLS